MRYMKNIIYFPYIFIYSNNCECDRRKKFISQSCLFLRIT